MGGQIVKRRKKGRPSKADLARRIPAAEEQDRRRSSRRRNVRYENFIDYDDYLDEFEEDEEEEIKRKEKKLKLVLLKLHNKQEREDHARAVALSEDDCCDNEEEPLKKRKINNDSEAEAEAEAEVEGNDDGGNEDHNNNDNDQEETERIADQIKMRDNSIPGTPSDYRPNGFLPLPDTKSLELILDKLQKKDTYGVYAEPVDLEELPDYLDVIDHPMDFATVRKKLGNGSYKTFEQFESDVFLICSNAMQYNAPDTIYYKQARTIQELARQKFEKLKIGTESTLKELKSENDTKSDFSAKKQLKKPLSRTLQEPVGSDFASGATLATAGDVQNGSVALQAGGCDGPSNADVLVEGSSSLVDNNVEKTEELSSGKCHPSKLGRKSSAVDENRRATYNASNHPVVKLESIFTTFEGEIKQLVAVGLYAEYSYARSLARFAATLGPVAWKVASQRIEQALPHRCKYGRGWVGEYEPLPTPVLTLETSTQRESFSLTNSHSTVDVHKYDVTSRNSVHPKECPVREPTSEGNPSLLCPNSGRMAGGKPSLFSSVRVKPGTLVNASHQQKNIPHVNSSETQNKASKQVELNLPPLNYQNGGVSVEKKQLKNDSEMRICKPKEVSRTMDLTQSVASKNLYGNGVVSGRLPNGEVTSGSTNGRMSSFVGVSNELVKEAIYLRQGHEQGLTDPVEAMRISADKAQKLQKPSNKSSTATRSAVSHDSGGAAVAAAHAWMSIGSAFQQPTENSTPPKSQISSESFYNPTQQLRSHIPQTREQIPLPAGLQFQFESKDSPFQAFMRPPVAVYEGQMPNRPMFFPQFVATDLSRFQMQPSWRAHIAPSQQKQEKFPPDLNLGVQSPGSPEKPSSGVIVDSQQPDLALQL